MEGGMEVVSLWVQHRRPDGPADSLPRLAADLAWPRVGGDQTSRAPRSRWSTCWCEPGLRHCGHVAHPWGLRIGLVWQGCRREQTAAQNECCRESPSPSSSSSSDTRSDVSSLLLTGAAGALICSAERFMPSRESLAAFYRAPRSEPALC